MVELLDRQAATGHRIENFETVNQVKVCVLGQFDFGLLYLTLMADDSQHEVDQVLLRLVFD